MQIMYAIGCHFELNFHDLQHRFCCFYVTQEHNKIGGYI